MIVARDIQKNFGDRRVLVGCDVHVRPGDRIGLVGVNGSGKSTLLRILAGHLEPDGGTLHREGTHAMLDQVPHLGDSTVGEVLDSAVGWHAALLAEHTEALDVGDLDRAGAVQDRLDTLGWDVGHRVSSIAERLGCAPREARTTTLSGGETRRIALAITLLANPDVLLLDEPTNHLDADAVEWLQAFLAGYRGSVLLTTHDRYLLEAVADRIVEVDEGRTITTEGSYGDWLIARAELSITRARNRERMLATISREADWASRSPAARTVKQKARLQRLDVLRDKLPAVRDRNFAFELKTGVPQGVTLLEAHDVAKRYGDRTLFESLEFVLRPSERIGIVGPNGAGKSTLLRVLMGEPADGNILRSPKARIGLLDQHRTGLDPTDTVFEAAGAGNDRVLVGDDWIHVNGFLERFAFEREQFGQRTASLSGGERARLLLARLMLQGATVLMLDEPTNDLDLDTLRVLEEALLGYDGGAVIVTHDRAFLDRVCTSVLAIEGGSPVAYANRSQWLEATARKRAELARAAARPTATPKPVQRSEAPRKRLSYKEQQELDGLPDRIEILETEEALCEAALADPAIYRDAEPLLAAQRRLAFASSAVKTAYARWEALLERS